MVSDQLAEVCRVFCNVCEADTQYDELLRHLRGAHGLSSKEGYGEYRFAVHRLHACHLCGRQVMFTRKNVGAHTLKVHQMVFPESARKYLVDVPQGKDGTPKLAGRYCTGTWVGGAIRWELDRISCTWNGFCFLLV